MKDLVLISGVSREMGMGYETARQLGEKGYRVIITARAVEKAEALAEKLRAQGYDVKAKALDVTSDESVTGLVKEIESEYGRLDVLINNAGGYYDGSIDILDFNPDYFKEVLETNLFGAWRMISAFTPLLRKSKNARVVNVTSGAGSYTDTEYGLLISENAPVYSLSKLILNGMTLKMSQRLNDDGIKVNVVCPGWVATYEGGLEEGARPVSKGSASIVWAATLPKDGPTGGLYRDGIKLGW